MFSFKLNIFDDTGEAADPKEQRDNSQCLGVSGAGIGSNNEWVFSRIEGKGKAQEVVGVFRQKAPANPNRHLGESEIGGYWAGEHGGAGLVGLLLASGAKIVGIKGHGDVTQDDCAAILDAWFKAFEYVKVNGEWTCPDGSAPVVTSTGESKKGTNWIVDIHGNPCKAGRGIPAIDIALELSDGRIIVIQIKVVSRKRVNEAGRFCSNGEQVLDNIRNRGQNIAFAVARRNDDGSMHMRWINTAKAMELQADAGAPFEATEGAPSKSYKLFGKDMTGEVVPGGGRAKSRESAFYLKYATGGNAKTGKAPNRELKFSMAALERLLGKLSDEERVQVATDWMPFSPTYLPDWIEDCAR